MAVGRTVGFVANDTRHMAGAVTSEAGDKAARFLQLCDAWGFPVVSLVDTPGMMVGPDAEGSGLEYGEAISDGRLSPADAAQGLRRAQRFLDRRLNRRHDTARSWPDFPPRAVELLLTADLPQDWSRLDD